MKLKLVIVFILFTCLPVLGQNIKFEHYNENNGLSYNSVRHIVQDEHGFMWLGTFFGLNRFDGYQFKTYMSSEFGKNKIYNDDITALELDKDANNLWIGTRKGLTLYQMDTNVFTTFFNEKNNFNSLPEDEIRSVLVDKFKKVWVGTMSQGLAIYYPNTQRFSRVTIKGFDYIKEIFEDKKGNIWVGSFGSGSVAKIILGPKGEIIKTTTYTLSIPNSNQKNPYINFIYEDVKSDIFVGTREGLYKLNKSKNTFENLYIEDAVLRNKLGPYFISIAKAPDG